MTQVYQRVVLVDDEAIQNKIHKMLIQRYLGRHYIEIISFTDAAQAIVYLQEENGSHIRTLVMLDLHMPLMNGWEFLDHLNHIDTNVTVVYIVSSSIIQTDIEKAYNHPKVEGYLVKPIDLSIEGLFADTLANLNDDKKS